MSDLLYEQQDHIVILTMNRPEKRNALGEKGDGELFADACSKINADKQIRCVILTGAGTVFSAGGDLKALLDRSGMFAGSINDLREAYRDGIHKIIRSLWFLEVPLIAAVNGPAIGLGNDLATTADIRLASESARFGAPFINLGLVPGDGGAWLLPHTIGHSRAAELFFTGEVINATTAFEWGMVSRVVAADQLMVESVALAEKIVVKPPIPVRMTKQMMRQAWELNLDTILDMSADIQVVAQHTDDHMTALRSVLDKTEVIFKGK